MELVVLRNPLSGRLGGGRFILLGLSLLCISSIRRNTLTRCRCGSWFTILTLMGLVRGCGRWSRLDRRIRLGGSLGRGRLRGRNVFILECNHGLLTMKERVLLCLLLIFCVVSHLLLSRAIVVVYDVKIGLVMLRIRVRRSLCRRVLCRIRLGVRLLSLFLSLLFGRRLQSRLVTM